MFGIKGHSAELFFCMIGNCVLSYKNAPRGCALGAGEDGCRSNRADIHNFGVLARTGVVFGDP